MQKDLCGGSIDVPGCNDIITPLNSLRTKADKFDFVFNIRDWHPENHISFASSHEGAEPYTQITLDSGDI